MRQLWAPWRLDYILQPKPDTCFFCEAVSGADDREALLLGRDDRAICIMNRYPYNNGHLMVAPTRHEGDIEKLEADELANMQQLLQRAVAILRESMSPEGFNIGLNLGEIAGAGVADHLHWHIVPRWNGDTNFMPVLGDVKVVPQALAELYDQLRPKFT